MLNHNDQGFIRRFRSRLLAAGLAGLAAAAPAMAGGGGLPVDFTAVEFPIEPAQMGTAIGIAGGTILVVTIGLMVGFRLVNRGARRATSAV